MCSLIFCFLRLLLTTFLLLLLLVIDRPNNDRPNNKRNHVVATETPTYPTLDDDSDDDFASTPTGGGTSHSVTKKAKVTNSGSNNKKKGNKNQSVTEYLEIQHRQVRLQETAVSNTSKMNQDFMSAFDRLTSQIASSSSQAMSAAMEAIAKAEAAYLTVEDKLFQLRSTLDPGNEATRAYINAYEDRKRIARARMERLEKAFREEYGEEELE